MKCHLVIVRWVDSKQPTSAWQFLAAVGEQHQRPVECATVGWLLKNNEEVMVVCQSVAGTGDLCDPAHAQANGVMTIPTVSVLSLERLEEVATPKDERKALGGHARTKALSSERRSEIARDAAQTRWGATARQKKEARNG